MKTIAQLWTDYEAAVVPVEAGPAQRQDMKQCFYAAFSCALPLMAEIADQCADDAVAIIQRFSEELECHVASLVIQRAQRK